MKLYLFLNGLSAALMFIKKGFDLRAIQVWLMMAALIAIPCYFEVHTHAEPTRTERILARLWLWFRRFVCFTAAFLFGSGAIFCAFSPQLSGRRLAALMMLLISLMLLWWGAIGPGKTRGFKDDLPTHLERKKRYNWK